jgi:hypothetical protein
MNFEFELPPFPEPPPPPPEPPLEPVALVSVVTATGEVEAPENAPEREFRAAWRLEGAVITLDVEAMKGIAKKRITEWRERELVKPILLDGVSFEADPQSVSLIDRATQLAEKVEGRGHTFETEWSDSQGRGVTMNRKKIDDLGIAIGVRTSELHVAARRLKEQIDAARTEAEIRAILATAEA